MGRLKVLHFGFGAPDLFLVQKVAMKTNADGFENNLRNIASHQGLSYLVSPQIGAFWRILVMLKRPYLKDSKWQGYKNLRNSSFSAFINFEVYDKSVQEFQSWQQFVGYPGLRLLMTRSQKIKMKYQTEQKFEWKDEEVKGFEAQIMQQAHDHLESIDPLMLAGSIQILDEGLRDEHSSNINKLLLQFKQQTNALAKDGQSKRNYYKRTPAFNRLRRQIVYCITDHQK